MCLTTAVAHAIIYQNPSISKMRKKEKSMKKLIVFLAAMLAATCFLLSACSGKAPAPSFGEPPSVEPSVPSSVEETALFYEGDETGYYLMDYLGTAAELTVPSTYQGADVIGVGAGVFNGNETLQKITLPQTVKTVEDDAFRDCVSLTTVAFSSGVEKIGSNAFDGCTSLTTVTGTENCLAVWRMAFNGCSSLKEINLTSCLYIGASAFENCTSLQKVISHYEEGKDEPIYDGQIGCFPGEEQVPPSPAVGICPSNMYLIGKRAFSGCTSLTTAYFRKNYFTMVEEEAFGGCTSLTTVLLSRRTEHVGKNAFSGCNAVKAFFVWKKIAFVDATANMPEEKLYYFSDSPKDNGNYWYHNYNLYGTPTPYLPFAE